MLSTQEESHGLKAFQWRSCANCKYGPPFSWSKVGEDQLNMAHFALQLKGNKVLLQSDSKKSTVAPPSGFCVISL